MPLWHGQGQLYFYLCLKILPILIIYARVHNVNQVGPGAHPASCTMGTRSFPGVKNGWGVTLTPHPLLVPRQERLELYVYSPYGPYSLYRASVPVQGCTLPFLLHNVKVCHHSYLNSCDIQSSLCVLFHNMSKNLIPQLCRALAIVWGLINIHKISGCMTVVKWWLFCWEILWLFLCWFN